MTTTIVEGTKEFPKVVLVEGSPQMICCPRASDPEPWCAAYTADNCTRCVTCPVKVVYKKKEVQ